MRKVVALGMLLAAVLEPALAADYILNSPDKANRIDVSVAGDIRYGVFHNEQLILAPSPVSMTIDDVVLGKDPIVVATDEQSVDTVLRPVVREKYAEIRDHYNSLTLTFDGRYSVEFRAYNDGVAYRFLVQQPGEITVNSEQIQYNFSQDHTATFPIVDGFYSHYERNYTTQALSALADDELSCLPTMVHFSGGVKAVITEADLFDYPGYYLKNDGAQTRLYGVQPGYPRRYEETVPKRGYSDRNLKVAEHEDFLAITRGERAFPWRLMVISDADADLIQSSLVYQLSSPTRIEDTAWIRPGKVAWDWYNANNIYGVDFEAGINTKTYEYYIDFAARYGLEYVILDEGWYDIEANDLTTPVDDIDLERLVDYANSKDVGLILWVTWKALDNQFEPAFAQFSRWGIKGIKVDFMQRDDQWMVKWYEQVAKRAADYKLLVDFHGSYKPAGLRRAYPNVVNREGVKGLEQHKWQGQFANPEHDVELPFMRMLAGPLDYTPGAMRNAQQRTYYPVFTRPMSLGTRVHQLAMYVIYEAPLQMLADSPSSYYKEADAMDFLAAVPTTWDDTQVLAAKFGDYVAIARRNGEEWYVGAMTDWDARDIEIDFAFLGDGQYRIDHYQDGINAEKYASDYKRTQTTVTRDTTLRIHLASGGGWAARITKASAAPAP